MTSTLLVDLLGSGPIPGAVAGTLIEAGIPASASSQQLDRLDLSTLSGESAIRLARRGAKWAAAIAGSVVDEATQIAIVEAKPFKTVLAAAVNNPNLGTDAAAVVHERADKLGETGTARTALARAATIAYTVATVTDNPAYDLEIAAERFGDIDDTVAAANTGVRLAASAIAAAHTPGSAVDNPECRTACISALDNHPKADAVIAHLIGTRRDTTLRIDTELSRSEHLPGLTAALIAVIANTGLPANRNTGIEYSDAALADIWRHGTTGEPTALAALIAALPVTDEMLAEAAGSDDDIVVSAVAKHIRLRRDDTDSSDTGAARYATIVAERWAHDGRRESSKLLTHPLSNAGVLNILRRGNANITAAWLAGRYPANPPTIELLAALEGDPGRAGTATIRRGGTTTEVTHGIDAGLIDAQRSAVIGASTTTTYDIDVVAHLRGTLSHSGGTQALRQAVLASLAAKLTERYGDNVTAWALTIEYANGHPGTIVELLDVVDASLS